MKFFAQWFKKNQELFQIVANVGIKRKVKLYLVGGAVRDVFLKNQRDNPDFDFCLKTGAINFARAVAKEMKAGFVALDKVHGCGRVVKKLKNKIITLDFSDFRGKTLKEDLFYRDFTINSMAVPFEDIFKAADFEKIVIDPCGGREDLAKGLLKIVQRKSFDDDPLRILRAFSFRAVFNFKISKEIYQLSVLKRKKLLDVSGERVRDELFKILSTSKGYEIIKQLDRYNILELIFPEICKMKKTKKRFFQRLNIWGHTMLTLKNTELLISRFNRNPMMKFYLSREISSGRKRAELLKLAALLHDLGKPGTFQIKNQKVQFHGHERLGACLAGNIALRLKLSNEELRFLKRIVFLHLRPGYLATNPVLTAKARFRFFRDAGDDAGSILILALADERSTKDYLLLDKIRKKYERVISRLLREYFVKRKEKLVRRLVDGNDIMKHFKLNPSPLIGKVLKHLEELQAIGKVKTKVEALAAGERFLLAGESKAFSHGCSK